MRIIYLHQYFTTPDMSGGTRSYEIAKRLVSAGHDVQMITSWRNDDERAPNWFVTEESGISVHWLPVPYSNNMSYPQRIAAFLKFAYHAIAKSKNLGGDIVFATSTPLTIAIPAVFSARALHIPMVFEVRDLWPDVPIALGALRNPLSKWAARKLEAWAYKHSEAIIALSPGMKAGIVRAGYQPERVAVIPNSSDNDELQYDVELRSHFRNLRSWLQNRPLLVYAGTFGRVNGVSYLVHLAKRLYAIDPEIRLLLVGSGQEKDAIQSLAEQEKVYGVNLFIEDSIAKKDIRSLLSAADISCSVVIDKPELQANSANKFFDSLASGTPILLNYGGWQHDLVKLHGCGLTMWQEPLDVVAKEVAKSIVDDAWLQKSGEAARALAESLFDRDNLAAQFEDVIVAASLGKGEQAESLAQGNYDA